MDKKYLVVYTCHSEKENAEWWQDQYYQSVKATEFEKFEDAKKFMRTEICKVFNNRVDKFVERFVENFMPEDRVRKKLAPELARFYKIIDKPNINDEIFDFKEIIETIITKPEWFADKDFKKSKCLDPDQYWAFVCDEESVLFRNDDDVLSFNVHNMEDENKFYYFECGLNCKQAFSFKLMNTEKTNTGNCEVKFEV